MNSSGISLQQIVTTLKQYRWLFTSLFFSGLVIGIIWRFFFPLPIEVSIQLPVVIRNVEGNALWDDLKVDALYHSLYQIINAETVMNGASGKRSWLELTEETFRLVVRDGERDIAVKAAENWAWASYETMKRLIDVPMSVGTSDALAVCIASTASEANYSCILANESTFTVTAEETNNTYNTLWIGEPENLVINEPSIYLNIGIAGIAGAVAGLMVGFFFVLIRLSIMEDNHET